MRLSYIRKASFCGECKLSDIFVLSLASPTTAMSFSSNSMSFKEPRELSLRFSSVLVLLVVSHLAQTTTVDKGGDICSRLLPSQSRHSANV